MTNQAQLAKIKRKPKKIVTRTLALFLVVLSVVLIYNVVIEITTTYRLQAEIKEVEEQLASVQKENGELISQKTKLEDPAYVQSYARGNYMFSKEGEKVYYLPSTKE